MQTTSTYAAYESQRLTRVAENLYRNGDGTYYGRIVADGKNHKRSFKTHDRKLADRKLAEFIKEIESKETQAEDVLFSKLADDWLASIKPRGKESSYDRRVTSLNQIKPAFKGKTIRDIKHPELTAWEANRADVSARTFNVDRETLSLIFAYAVKPRGILSKNPIDKDTMPKRKETKAVIVPPTREQFAALLKVMRENKADRTKEAPPFIEFLAYTGMRLDEALNVQWRHVDFAKGSILVTGGDTGTKNHSQRSIPLFEPARALLLKMSNGKTMPPTAYLFNHKSSKKALMHASEVIGLPEGEHFTHHDMRHFFCTNAIEKNIPDHVIAGWLGHKDGGVLVKKTYGHLRHGHSNEMAKLMDFAG